MSEQRGLGSLAIMLRSAKECFVLVVGPELWLSFAVVSIVSSSA